MTLDEYQDRARRTKNRYDDPRLAIGNWSMGLAGEAGELIDMLKKVYFHDHPANRDALVKELGDVLWYVAVLSDELGIDLEEVARTNIEKLEKRYPQGFSKQRSQDREG